MAYTKLNPRLTPGAQVEEISPGNINWFRRIACQFLLDQATNIDLHSLMTTRSFAEAQFPLRFLLRLRSGQALSLSLV